MVKSSYLWAILATLAYWGWESRASGNIRVDLLVLYPLLIGIYTSAFWSRLRWWSLLASFLLMAVNVAFFVMSYQVFHKHPG